MGHADALPHGIRRTAGPHDGYYVQSGLSLVLVNLWGRAQHLRAGRDAVGDREAAAVCSLVLVHTQAQRPGSGEREGGRWQRAAEGAEGLRTTAFQGSAPDETS